VALAAVERLRYAYPGAETALDDVSLTIEPGEVVLLLGASGSGKSTLLRALAGLVPHFHGGRFAGRVVVDGRDTRSGRPADLAGTVGTLFQDPEDQVVLSRVENEVAFGLENLGTPPAEIAGRARSALRSVGVEHLIGRPVTRLSGGELQRVCLASVLALEPRLLLLDEPSSQLDPEAAERLFAQAAASGAAVVCSEQRPALPLGLADRVVFLERGRILLDAPRAEALRWLAAERPAWVGEPEPPRPRPAGEVVCRLESVTFGYGDVPILEHVDLELRRGEVVALAGPNGSGKTTLAKLAAGLLSPQRGSVARTGRAGYLCQDPGRYLVAERADEEVAVAVAGDLERAGRALTAVGLSGRRHSHPRDLSSGERERLALAAVAVAEPDLLVLDEPTRGVDPQRKRELAGWLRSASACRSTLVVTHDRGLARAVADRTLWLDHAGRLCGSEPVVPAREAALA
jgi:energy-coupling factor transport system ATP-binding protein